MTSFDQRREERSHISNPIEYALDPHQIYELYDGGIENISKFGLCIVTSLQLKEDQEIYIRSPNSLPFHVARARWIEEYDHEHYKVGLEFVSS